MSVAIEQPAASTPTLIRHRDANLDLFRAAAIAMVVVYHVVIMSPARHPTLAAITDFGKYGVDVFFVLSGWLIGGLYWRELARTGDVKLARFLPRRWIRTVPPYLGGLAIAWLPVWAARREPFDWGYLFFIQNYYRTIPYYVSSWSLCVEEHFYLVFPLGLNLARRLRLPAHQLLPPIVAVSFLSRCWLAHRGLGDTMGFTRAASHLRLDGLALGFYLAWFGVMNEPGFARLKRWADRLFIVAWIVLAGLPFLSDAWMYQAGLTLMALALGVLLVHRVGKSPGWFARSRITHWVALTSYSVYLVNVPTLHVVDAAMGRLPGAFYFPLAFGAVAASGTAFFLAVEYTSLLLRDRIAPKS